MNKQEQWLHRNIDAHPNLTTIYRESETFDEYIQKALELGADEDEAREWWDELNFKYSQ